ncbi:hypothetical protein PV342_12515 [Streptomyces sp. PA03-3a]|nr:hypothetical protein [Streptomyces sp. PA03-3a]
MTDTPAPAAAACFCVIAHPTTPEERDEVSKALAYARQIGDVEALPLLVARLTGSCPARA